MAEEPFINEWVEWVATAQLIEAAEDWHRITQMPEVPSAQRRDARLNCDAIFAELGMKVQR